MCDSESSSPQTPVNQEDFECLKVRKWWCFLLSSIFTFLAGLAMVLIWRALAFICCRKESGDYSAPGDPKLKGQEQLVPVPPGGQVAVPLAPGQKPGRQQQQEFEATFMTEAKDWAGELISGQTTTGRILVSPFSLPKSISKPMRSHICFLSPISQPFNNIKVHICIRQSSDRKAFLVKMAMKVWFGSC